MESTLQKSSVLGKTSWNPMPHLECVRILKVRKDSEQIERTKYSWALSHRAIRTRVVYNIVMYITKNVFGLD